MIVCLTGGIGSGKSVVAKIFENLGAIVFNSDHVAKELYSDSTLKPQIINLLGENAYLADGSINKPFINSVIFSQTTKLDLLNSIIHPAVIKKFNILVKHNQNRVIIKETALLFEARLEDNCDTIVVVAANDSLRIDRVMKRDSLTREEVIKKLNSQISQREKIARANYVIENNEQNLLIPQVIDLYKNFLRNKHA